MEIQINNTKKTQVRKQNENDNFVLMENHLSWRGCFCAVNFSMMNSSKLTGRGFRTSHRIRSMNIRRRQSGAPKKVLTQCVNPPMTQTMGMPAKARCQDVATDFIPHVPKEQSNKNPQTCKVLVKANMQIVQLKCPGRFLRIKARIFPKI